MVVTAGAELCIGWLTLRAGLLVLLWYFVVFQLPQTTL